MNKAFFDKPVMTADGTICIDSVRTVRYWAQSDASGDGSLAGWSVRDAVAGWLEAVRGNTIRIFSNVSKVEPLEEWEWNYITESMRPELRQTPEQWAARRAPYVGAWCIWSGIEEESLVFKFYTTDRALAMAFWEAMQANPGYPAAKAWNDRCAEDSEKRRNAYPRIKAFREAKQLEWESKQNG